MVNVPCAPAMVTVPVAGTATLLPSNATAFTTNPGLSSPTVSFAVTLPDTDPGADAKVATSFTATGASSNTLTVIVPFAVSPSLSVATNPKFSVITSFAFVPSAWSNCPTCLYVYDPSSFTVNVNTTLPFAVPV